MKHYIAENSDKLLKTLGYSAAFIAFGMVAAILGPTLTRLAENTDTSLSKISILFTARSFGYMIGAFFLGRLYDRFPGHPMIAGGVFMLAVMAVLTPIVPVLWLLVLFILLTGIGEAIIEVGNNTLLVWVHQQHVGPYMNALHFFFGVGAFLSPIIVARVLIITDNIIWAYWIVALFMIPIIIGLLMLKSPAVQGLSEDGIIEQMNDVLVALICLLFLLYVGAEISFGGWIHTYTLRMNLADEATAAYLTSAFWGALTLGRFIAIPLAAHLKPQTLLLIDFIGSVFSIVIILFINHITAVWVGTFGFGLSMASFFPTLLAFAERRIRITGKVTSWFGIGAALGAMTLPLLIGQLFERFGPKITMLAILFDLLIAIGIFTWLVVYSARIKMLPQRSR